MTWINQTKEIVDLVITQEFIPSLTKELTIREENMNYSIGLNHFEDEKKIKMYIKPEDIWEIASEREDEICDCTPENSWQVIHEENRPEEDSKLTKDYTKSWEEKIIAKHATSYKHTTL
jgi:hypothetical protein